MIMTDVGLDLIRIHEEGLVNTEEKCREDSRAGFERFRNHDPSPIELMNESIVAARFQVRDGEGVDKFDAILHVKCNLGYLVRFLRLFTYKFGPQRNAFDLSGSLYLLQCFHRCFFVNAKKH